VFYQLFQANSDATSTAINRFHQPAIAQIIRLDIFDWNVGYDCCARMEVFSCSNTGGFLMSGNLAKTERP
jgi:hypothetical protein